MGANPFIGIVYHWIGGFASATNFIPFRRIRRWSWEIYWIVQGIAAWLIAPTALAALLVPHLFTVIRRSPPGAIGYAVLFGMLWGVGGLTFGLSVRYLGIALGYAISLGLCTAFGTLIPPLYTGAIGTIAHAHSGQVTLAGVGVCLLAVVVNGCAGWSKEREVTAQELAESGEREFSLGKGIGVAVFAGIMSSFFAFGLTAGAPIAAVAARQLHASGRLDLWRNLPVLVVVLWGGFFTNSRLERFCSLSGGARGISSPALPVHQPHARRARASGDTLQDVSTRKSSAAESHPRCLAATTSSPRSQASSGTSNFSSTRLAKRKWAGTTSPPGPSTWPPSSSSQRSGACSSRSGSAPAGARVAWSPSACRSSSGRP